MKWIHLSDIHYSPQNDGRSTYQLRTKLPQYITENHICADHLFITGDFRNAKYQRDDDGTAAVQAAQFILEIADAAKIASQNIHIIPGNHDLTRTAQIERLSEIKRNYNVHDGRFREDDLSFLLERFRFFQQLVLELGKHGVPARNSFTSSSIHATYLGTEFNLLYFNTCLVCNSNEDRGNLIVGNYDLYLCLEKIKHEQPDKPIIVLAHHGMDNFRADERKTVERLFEEYPVILYLCGDAHLPWRRSTNGMLELTMGCLIQGANIKTVFSIGELQEGKCSIEAHEWDADEGEWGEYTQFNKKLKIWPIRSEDTKRHLAEIVTRERPAIPSAHFLGRKDELKQIEFALGESRIVFLHGMGGMGKSELCRKLFEIYSYQSSIVSVNKIGWITYHGSLRESFFGQFPEIQSDHMDEYWAMVKWYIAEQADNLLLIIDNMNAFSQDDISELSGLNCKIVVTSRIGDKITRFRQIEMDTLSLEDCRQLYRIHSQDNASGDNVIDQIISRSAGHTLSIELLAKTQFAAGMDANELLQRLLTSGFDLKDVREDISYQHNPEQGYYGSENARFIEHMSRIFNLADVRENEEELCLLQQISLLAPNIMIPVKSIKKWLGLCGLNALNSVAQKGWLTQYNGNQEISIHPVIAKVVQHMTKLDTEIANILASRLANDLKLEGGQVFVEKMELLIHAETFVKSVDISTMHYAMLLNNMAVIYDQRGDYGKALEWYRKALAIQERILGSGHWNTVSSYNNIAAAYFNQGKYDEALKWSQKVLKNFKRELAIKRSEAVSTYNNIAAVYDCRGKYDKALKWYQKALAVSEKVFGPEHPDTSVICNNIANIYCSQGKYDKALEWHQKVLNIRKKVLGAKHPDLAYTYNNTASVYRRCGEYNKALAWYQKALEIREQVLGAEHPDTATIYNNIAFLYNSQNEYADALEWYQKALSILEKKLGPKHPKTIAVYRNIADVYKNQGNAGKAQEWYQKSMGDESH